MDAVIPAEQLAPPCHAAVPSTCDGAEVGARDRTLAPGRYETGEMICGMNSLRAFGRYDQAEQMWMRRLRLAGGQELCILEDPSGTGMHGEATLWGGSLQLAKYIDTVGLATPTAELPTPRPTVVELGAGCGLASMTAAVSGAAVIATEHSRQLDFLRKNILLNRCLDRHELSVCKLHWGEADEATLGCSLPVDVIIGADITYNQLGYAPLLETLLALAAPHTRVLLAHDNSSTALPTADKFRFFGEVASTDFDVAIIDVAAVLPAEFIDDDIFMFELRRKEHRIAAKPALPTLKFRSDWEWKDCLERSVRTLESSRLIERAYGQADVSSLQDSSMLAAMPPSACTTADSAQAAAMVTLDPEDLD